MAFSQAHGGSLSKTQDFLRSSDFYLRNIWLHDGQATFVYAATKYPTACGWNFSSFDGIVVGVKTNLVTDPTITGFE
jgi:hypothetical protein